MQHAFRNHFDRADAVAPAAPRPASAVARGGPVAELQQSIQERIAGRDIAVTVLPPRPRGAAERLIEHASRVAGPVALGLAYGATALAFLG